MSTVQRRQAHDRVVDTRQRSYDTTRIMTVYCQTFKVLGRSQ